MYSYKKCVELVEKELKQVKYNKTPVELYDPVNYVLSGEGKRIRPALLLMSCNLFSDDVKNALKPAVAIEVFHNFTLLHDDIMDNAVLRRNKPTVHIKWDTNIAILSGDAMLIKAYEMLNTGDQKKLTMLLKEFNKAALEVCEGQQFDMNYEKILDVSINDYINMIRLKTSVLLACSFKMGAIIGGAGKADQQLLYDIGINMGIGFQLQDDMLDSFGNSTTFGKKIGGDIVSNKKTFLLITALNQAKGETYNKLKKLITCYEVSREEKIEQVLEIYNQLDIKKKTESEINNYFDIADKCLNKISVDDDRKKIIRSFMYELMKRSR